MVDGFDMEEGTSGLLWEEVSIGPLWTRHDYRWTQHKYSTLAFLLFFLQYHLYILDSGYGKTPLGLNRKYGGDIVPCFMHI